jgi:transcriptional regulator with XRE-family HTH domain
MPHREIRHITVDKNLAICAILRAMNLRAWRQTQQLTMAEAAVRICVDSARTYQRYETGENRPDAPVVERIRLVTCGSVSLSDLHQQRLDWLRANRPDVVSDLFERAAE